MQAVWIQLEAIHVTAIMVTAEMERNVLSYQRKQHQRCRQRSITVWVENISPYCCEI